MQANVGDRIVVDSEKVGVAAREGEILEVIEADYGTSFRVHWEDGRETRSTRPREAPASRRRNQ